MRGTAWKFLVIMALGVATSQAAMIYDNIDDFTPSSNTYYESSMVVNLGSGPVEYWVAEDFYTGNLEADEIAELTSVEWIGKFNNLGPGGAEIVYSAEVIILTESAPARGDLATLSEETLLTGLTYTRATTLKGSAVVDRFNVALPATFDMAPDTHYYVGVRLRSPQGLLGGSHAVASVGNPQPAPEHSQTSAVYKDPWFYPDWTLMSSDPWWAGQGNLEYAIALNGTITPEPTSFILLVGGVLIVAFRRK